MKAVGDGLRGWIPTMNAFKIWLFTKSSTRPDITWDLEVQLVDFERLGFDAQDREWFRSEYFCDSHSIADPPNELKALCFLASWIE